MSRAYTVCKCGSWVFTDRIGAGKLEYCRACGKKWPGIQKPSNPERIWRSQHAGQPTGPRQEGKIHRALHSLWEKFTPEVQQGLVAAGWKPKAEPKHEAPPGLPRVGAGGHLGKGKGKGKQTELAEHDSAHQALWESASSEQRAWLHQLGFQSPHPSEPSDLKTLIKAHMDQLPETLQQAIASLEPPEPVPSATQQVEPSDLKTLIKAHMDQLPETLQQAIASLEPPEPVPSATQQVLSATKKFKASTNELRQLIHKSAALQVKIDRAKAAYADLLDQMKTVQTELADKDQTPKGTRVQGLARKGSSPLALTQCGIILSSEQQALLEGSMEVDPAPLVAPKLNTTAEEGTESAAQPQGAQPPADWPDGQREGKHRSRSRGRAQG
eukprot:s5374_g7.t1